jgi:ethanolamine utilization protein EutP
MRHLLGREIMTKRVMIVGPTGSGKTSLLKALGIWEQEVRKTEAISFGDEAVDTPGEFFDIPHFFHALIMTSVKAGVILMVADPLKRTRHSSRFAHALRAPVIGVITKLDAATPEDVDAARKSLKHSGVTEIYAVSSQRGDGIDALGERVRKLRER